MGVGAGTWQFSPLVSSVVGLSSTMHLILRWVSLLLWRRLLPLPRRLPLCHGLSASRVAWLPVQSHPDLSPSLSLPQEHALWAREWTSEVSVMLTRPGYGCPPGSDPASSLSSPTISSSWTPQFGYFVPVQLCGSPPPPPPPPALFAITNR